MRRAEHVARKRQTEREFRNTIFLLENLKRKKKQFGRSGPSRGDTKIVSKKSPELTLLAYDRNQWWALVQRIEKIKTVKFTLGEIMKTHGGK
jgi:hypothetical protein